jgi:hypothetical protein
MDLYSQMGDELRSLFKDLFQPKRKGGVEKKMEEIVKTASQIGGSLHSQAEELYKDVIHFLKSPNDKKMIAIMKKHALRLEQETREI